MGQRAQGERSMMERETPPSLRDGSSDMRRYLRSLPEESKKRLSDCLENIRRAIMTLEVSIINMTRETDTVNQIADDINLLVLASAVESVLLREAKVTDPICAVEVKKFAADTMHTTYQASSPMEKVVADLAAIWKSIKQTEGSLRYILSGAQKLGAKMSIICGAAEDGLVT